MNLDELTEDDRRQIGALLLAIEKMCIIYGHYHILVETETDAKQDRLEMMDSEMEVICSYLKEKDFQCPDGVRERLKSIREEIYTILQSLEAQDIRQAKKDLHRDVHQLHDDIELIARQVGFELYPPRPERVSSLITPKPEKPKPLWKRWFRQGKGSDN
jgi:hypothetical protein